MSDLIEQQWATLRQHTPARIGIGRAGVSQPTAVNLHFARDHARARDAVLAPLNAAELQAQLTTLGLPLEWVHSAAVDRRTYLQRPDLGRSLRAEDAERLRQHGCDACDIVIVVADGLSSQAVMRHAAPLLRHLLPLLMGYHLAPLCVALQARVALGDVIGAALNARMALLLIGERPGLSSADSLGIYLTWNPRPGRVDAERNCISNIRPQGLDFVAAAHTCHYLVQGAFTRQLTGVELKDQSQTLENAQDQRIPFLRPHDLT